MDKLNDQNWDDFKLRHEAAVAYAQSALKTLVLVNGGAIIALLTFIGNQGGQFDPRGISWSFVWFGLGLSFAIGAHFPAYLSQIRYLESARFRLSSKKGTSSRVDGLADDFAVSVFVALTVSLCFFLAGAFVGLVAIT